MDDGQFKKARGQVPFRATTKRVLLFCRERRLARAGILLFHPPALVLDPRPLLLCESGRLAPGSPAGHGDADTPVLLDAKHVATGAAVANEDEIVLRC